MVHNKKKKDEISKGSRQSRILRQYFWTYAIVLFVPLLICSIYYIRMFFLIGEDDIRVKQNELEHASVLLDITLEEFEYLGNSLAVNPLVCSFKNEPEAFGFSNTYKIYTIKASLPDLYLTNQSIFDYFIFFDKSEVVVNKEIAYTYEEFYKLFLHEIKYDNYEEWYAHIREEETSFGFMPLESFVYQSEENVNLLAYTRPLTVDTPGRGKVCIYLEESALNMLMPAAVNHGIQFIRDRTGKLIYLRSDNIDETELEKALNLLDIEDETVAGKLKQSIVFMGKRYLLIGHNSEESGITCYMMLPQSVVYGRVMSSIMILGLFLLVSVALGIFLSYNMSLKNAMPINEILNQVSWSMGVFGEHQSAFSILKTTFNYLVTTNTRLADAIESQKPYIRNAFINRLIFGNFPKEEEALKTASHLGIPCQERIYGIIIFRFSLLSEYAGIGSSRLLDSCVLSLLEAIEKELPESLYTNLGDEQVVLLINLPKVDIEKFRMETEQLIFSIKENMPFNISQKLFVYGGNEVDRLEQISESFHNAAYMFQNEKGQIENTVIWYQKLEGYIPNYPTQDLSLKLTHYVTAGDNSGLHDMLKDIIQRYLIDNSLPVYLQNMLLNELQIILFRLLGYIEMEEEEYKKYYMGLEENYNAPLIAQITATLNLYRQLCEYVSKQKQLQDSLVVNSAILSYINANYADADLSLTSVADQFGISEPYLSNIFKQTQGINFSTYVEILRIGYAKNLLKTTSLTVGEISGLVGYGSTNSFCRAFKRVTGLSASEYRKNSL